jgi:hypothetical protein
MRLTAQGYDHQVFLGQAVVSCATWGHEPLLGSQLAVQTQNRACAVPGRWCSGSSLIVPAAFHLVRAMLLCCQAVCQHWHDSHHPAVSQALMHHCFMYGPQVPLLHTLPEYPGAPGSQPRWYQLTRQKGAQQVAGEVEVSRSVDTKGHHSIVSRGVMASAHNLWSKMLLQATPSDGLCLHSAADQVTTTG